MVDGQTDHGYTISSLCEPNGSGELKKLHANGDCKLGLVFKKVQLVSNDNGIDQ